MSGPPQSKIHFKQELRNRSRAVSLWRGCYWLNWAPQHSYVGVITPVAQNATLFGNKVFIEVIKFKLVLRVGFILIWLVAFKKKFDHTFWENTPQISRQERKPQTERHSPHSVARNKPCLFQTSSFRSETVKFLLFKPASLWSFFGCLSKLRQRVLGASVQQGVLLYRSRSSPRSVVIFTFSPLPLTVALLGGKRVHEWERSGHHVFSVQTRDASISLCTYMYDVSVLTWQNLEIKESSLISSLQTLLRLHQLVAHPPTK